MAVMSIVLALVLSSSAILEAVGQDSTEAEILNQKWSEDWIEKAPEGFGKTWMIFEDENGVPRIANATGITPVPSAQYDVDVNEVTFKLYTNKTAESPEELLIDEEGFLGKSAFDPSHPVKIVTHGWRSSANSVAALDITKAYLKRGEYNVITVDWSKLADTFIYPTAAYSTQDVGKRVAKLIEKILENGKKMSKKKKAAYEKDLLSRIHILGHSLGAHVAGHAGKALGEKKVGRITGLDPARPGFELLDAVPSLSKQDADFVDVIHTTAGTLGIKESIGHVDFYPNGGYAVQPGCCCILGVIETCSHGRSYRYYAESINSDNLIATRCDNFKDFTSGLCDGREKAVMGEDVPLETRGIYYLNTNFEPPYAMPPLPMPMLHTNGLTDEDEDEEE